MNNLYRRQLVMMYKQQEGTADRHVQLNVCQLYCMLRVIQRANSHPLEFQGLPDFTDNPHMKVSRFSALRIGRLYPRI